MLWVDGRGLRDKGVVVRNAVVSGFVSLDGVMEAPEGWTFRFASEEQRRYKSDEPAASDALLLGRTTYEGFAAAWPGTTEGYEGPRRAEPEEYADTMNGYPKHVASTTLGAAGVEQLRPHRRRQKRSAPMVIVAGHITVEPQQRESYLAGCVIIVEQARKAAGCLDCAITADLIDPGRVNIFERWESQVALEAFRSSGPKFEQGAARLSVSVAEYDIADVRPLFGDDPA